MSNTAVLEEDSTASLGVKRLRGFAIHLVIYFIVMAGGVIVNFLLAPGEWWFAFPMVAWGAPLALHAAYAMGLFGGTDKTDE